MIFGIPVFLAILAFVLVIFIHELGHYMVGRLCGIGVNAFSIGFGPKLISFMDKNNTEWKLCLIPLGGFVQFQSNDKSFQQKNVFQKENNKNSMVKVAQCDFEAASILARSLTVISGPLANFLMSVLIFAFVAMIAGTMSNKPIIGNVIELPNNRNALMPGDRVLSVQGTQIETFSEIYDLSAQLNKNDTIELRVLRGEEKLDLKVPYLFQPVVLHVEMFSPAMKAGIQVGDVFVKANDYRISSFDDMRSVVNYSEGNPISVMIWRNGMTFNSTIYPEMRPTQTQNGDLVEEMRIGVRGGPFLSPKLTTPNVFEAFKIGVQMTGYVVKTSLVGLARIIDNTISPKHLSGPVGVAKALSYSALEGFIPFLSLFAAISAGIGLVNLFPIPILDGGHLIMLLYEFAFKKTPPDYLVKFLMMVGFFILFALMIFATFNDIVR